MSESTIQRYGVGQRLSEAVVHQGTVWLSGQVAEETLMEGAKAQTEEILGLIDRWLGEAGSHKTRVLSAQIWLADMADYDEMNEAWSAWVPAGYAPARATVQATLAHPYYRVEIKVVAALGEES